MNILISLFTTLECFRGATSIMQCCENEPCKLTQRVKSKFLAGFNVRLRNPISGLLLLFALAPTGFAQTVPNVQQPTPGTLLAGPVDPDMGRLSVIEYLGGYVVTIPEAAGSEPNDHLLVKAWDFSNPNNPIAVQPINPAPEGGHFGRTRHPFLAHGTIKRDNEIFIGGSPNAIRVNQDGSLEHAEWSGAPIPLLIDFNGNHIGQTPWWTKSGMMRPWHLTDDWDYNSTPGLAKLSLGGQMLAEWNITQDSGVAGFGSFLGNLLIYSSDQRHTGVAVYDVSDISADPDTGQLKPRLLDTLHTSPSGRGIGGYWSEISGHYIVFARRLTTDLNQNFLAGVQVVDFSDPTNLRLHCDISFPGSSVHWTLGESPMYVGFQDEYIYSDSFKINIETCDVELALDTTQGQTGTQCYSGGTCPKLAVDTSQYSRVIGNLWLSGGGAASQKQNVDGMAVWVHQSAPDSRAPYVAHHIPEANQTNYPIDVPLGFSIPETIRSQTIVVTATAEPGEPESLTLTEVGGEKVNIDYVLSHTGILTVEPLQELIPNTTYEVEFTNAIRDAAGNSMEPYSFRFSTGNNIDGGSSGGDASDPAVIDSINTTPGTTIPIGEFVTVSIVSSNATEYEITLDGETASWQGAASRSFSFEQPGEYFVNVRARNSEGVSALERVRLLVSSSSTLAAGNNSSQLFCDASNHYVWAINPDNDSVTKIETGTNQKLLEVEGPDAPQSIAKSSRDELWVTASAEDRIYIYSQSGALIQTLDTGYGSMPMHVVASNDGTQMFVTLYGSGRVLRYQVNSLGSGPASVNVGSTPKAMALSPNGSTLLVGRHISSENWGEVYEINVGSWSLARTFRLHKHLIDDQLTEGRGIPNYLSSIIITPDSRLAFVAAKKDNTDRGLINGLNQDLDPDNTVRTMMMVLDLNSGMELHDRRVDFDNAESPSALSISDDGTYLFVALQGKNTVMALGMDTEFRLSGSQNNIYTGLAPQGMCMDPLQNTLYVKNYTERSVAAIDLSSGVNGPDVSVVSTVDNEKLSASELSGLQIFYNSFNGLENSNPIGKMSAEGYISCATCHIGGGQDGRTYDFTGRGEGLRNSISLKGRGGTRFGNVHWSANFDEIQDFEHDMRGPFGGTGLLTDQQFASANTPLGTSKTGMSQELDDLAAYVSSLGKESLPRSPARSGDSPQDLNTIGQQVFQDLNCQTCHSGTAFTDTVTHDVGTIRAHSGNRLGGQLEGIKTPSLLGVFATAPYLHDGSAKTIEDVFNTVGGAVLQAEEGNVNSAAIITQTGYSYMRGAAGVRFTGNGSGSLQLNNIDGGSGGVGKLRIRYGSSHGQQDFDFDGDGVPDVEDNCPFDANDGQWDWNNDGIGDACSKGILSRQDTDGDGIVDFDDNCRFVANPGQQDTNGDGVGDLCVTDNTSQGSNGGLLEVRVNGVYTSVILEVLPQVEGQDVVFTETTSLDINLAPGTANSIELQYYGGSAIIDELTLSNADDVARAGAHNVAASVSPSEREQLVEYIMQLDRASAPEDDDTSIFGDGDSAVDTDEDGNADASDNCPNTTNPDQEDQDGNGIGDACDTFQDSDGDGIADGIDNCPFAPNLGQQDSDGDGIGDACDTPSAPQDSDFDGDGVPDVEDNCPFDANDGQWDWNNDGIGDACSKGILSRQDTDGDGIVDFDDNCRFVANPGQQDTNENGIGEACDTPSAPQDSDGDGVPDAEDNCPFVANSGQWDSDGDGIGEACDTPSAPQDSDGDGVPDAEDNCPFVANSGQWDWNNDGIGDACNTPSVPQDSDGDGVPDAEDNCPFVANSGQWDSDGDGIGEACDTPSAPQDSDGDGVPDAEDNCPFVANSGQWDWNNDGIGDACNTPSAPQDSDGDGVPDAEDNCPFVANSGQWDWNNDGIGDACNTPSAPQDSDGDGVPDAEDNCPFVANSGQWDSDGDGIGEACDTPSAPQDSDGDGFADSVDNCPAKKNYMQVDSNNDGVGDACSRNICIRNSTNHRRYSEFCL